MSPPKLIIVAGPPGAGKSTLARKLSRTIRCPLISRDDIKEGFLFTRVGTPRDADERANDAFFEVLRTCLDHGTSVIAEAAFQHRIWAPAFPSLTARAAVRLIVLEIPPDVALQRRRDRLAADPERARYHPDREARGAAPIPSRASTWRPPRFEVPTLAVRTEHGFSPPWRRIVSFAVEDASN